MSPSMMDTKYAWLVCPHCGAGEANRGGEFSMHSRLTCPLDPDHGHMRVQEQPPQLLTGSDPSGQSLLIPILEDWLYHWKIQSPDVPSPQTWRTSTELHTTLKEFAHHYMPMGPELMIWANSQRLALHLRGAAVMLAGRFGYQRRRAPTLFSTRMTLQHRFGMFDEINPDPDPLTPAQESEE